MLEATAASSNVIPIILHISIYIWLVGWMMVGLMNAFAVQLNLQQVI